MSKNYYGKPYYSLDAWCKENYGHKLYKVALDLGCSCPNRDGTISTGGCIFCSEGGSGDFAERINSGDFAERINSGDFAERINSGDIDEKISSGDFAEKSGESETTAATLVKVVNITQQLEQGKARLRAKWPDIDEGQKIIAYFQAYTNTYGDIDRLEAAYTAALSDENVAGISIATRPDCLGEEVLGALQRLKIAFPRKFVWVELGLQTIHEESADYINRGYAYPAFLKAMEDLKKCDIPVIVHLILGLPGEGREEVLESIDEMNRVRPFGIKLQLLHILEGTKLGEQYKRGEIFVLSKEEYLDLLVDCIRTLDDEICIHRVTGDGPKDILLAPLWSRDKRGVLNALHQRLCYNQ